MVYPSWNCFAECWLGGAFSREGTLVLQRTSLSYFGKLLQEGTPGERMGTLSRLFFSSAAKRARYGLFAVLEWILSDLRFPRNYFGQVLHVKQPRICSIIWLILFMVDKPYCTCFVAFTKSSRERGCASPGGGFGRMFRIAWYSAKQLGAQPSGTFSCQQAAN